MEFPLYDTLMSTLRVTPIHALTDDEQVELAKQLRTLSENEASLAYMLIRTHAGVSCPYNSRQFKKGVRFDLSNLPTEVQHLLSLFILKTREHQV